MSVEAQQAARASDCPEAITSALYRQRVAVAVVEFKQLRAIRPDRIGRGCAGRLAMTGTEQRDEDAILTGDARIITPGAERMRRSRERRRQGGVVVSVAVTPNVPRDLVSLGWLPGPDHGDKDAIARTLKDLIDRAIRARVTPPTGPHDQLGFMCTIQRSTIETLVSLGWLRADQQDDLAAIVKAFRRFAGRALAVACNSGRDRWCRP